MCGGGGGGGRGGGCVCVCVCVCVLGRGSWGGGSWRGVTGKHYVMHLFFLEYFCSSYICTLFFLQSVCIYICRSAFIYIVQQFIVQKGRNSVADPWLVNLLSRHCAVVSCGRCTFVKVCIQVYEDGSEVYSVCGGVLPSV